MYFNARTTVLNAYESYKTSHQRKDCNALFHLIYSAIHWDCECLSVFQNQESSISK